MSGRDARRARQRKAERAARFEAEVTATLQFIARELIIEEMASGRRLQSILGEFFPPAKDSPWAKYGGRYVDIDFGVDSPFRHVIDEAAPFRAPADLSAHTWTRVPARWNTEILTVEEREAARKAAERDTNATIRRHLFR